MITEIDRLHCKKMIYQEMRPYVKHHDKEDLYQSGELGVTKAELKYDPSYNVKFTTHAYPYIKGEIVDFVRRDSVMRVSPDMLKKYRSILKTQEALMQSGLEQPSYMDIGLLNNMEAEEVEMVVELVQRSFVQSADAVYEDENVDLYNQKGHEEHLMKPEIQDLYAAIALLEPEQQELVRARHFEGYSQQEVAQMYNMSQAKVSRQEKAITKQLKKTLTPTYQEMSRVA